jgi:hypothetical protein
MSCHFPNFTALRTSQLKPKGIGKGWSSLVKAWSKTGQSLVKDWSKPGQRLVKGWVNASICSLPYVNNNHHAKPKGTSIRHYTMHAFKPRKGLWHQSQST